MYESRKVRDCNAAENYGSKNLHEISGMNGAIETRTLGSGPTRRRSAALPVLLAGIAFAAATLFAPAPAAAQTTVAADWGLVPSGLSVGDQFRLLFATSTSSTASSTDIATYNTNVQALAAAGHTDIQAYSSGFRVVGCTTAVNANTNTSTTYTATDKGVPIYWLNGNKVADNYEDFYDGDWDDEANPRNESGSGRTLGTGIDNRPFTGCNHDGTSAGSNLALGAPTNVRLGRPNNTQQGNGPIGSGSSTSRDANRPFYALSQVFEVGSGNSTPGVLNEIEDTTGTEGMAFEYRFPRNTFRDADGDTLEYSATLADDSALPSWLAFAPGTRTFSSTRLPDAAVGTTMLKVTATDGTASVSDEFNLVVSANCPVPQLGSRRQVWRGAVTVAEGQAPVVFGGDTFWGYNESGSVGSLSDTNFDLGSATYSINFFVTYQADGGAWQLVFEPDGEMSEVQGYALRLHVCDQHVDIADTFDAAPDPAFHLVAFAESESTRFDWSGVTTRTVALSAPANRPPVGQVEIDGTLIVGRTLTADTSAFSDADGLVGVAYTYQWIREDEDGSNAVNIARATGKTYTLTPADAMKKIRVMVTYKDNLHVEGQTPESLTSAAYPQSGTVGAAQSSSTLVSNIEQSAGTDVSSTTAIAVAFTTGSHTGGYTLSSVDVVSRNSNTFALAVCELDTNDLPDDASCTALTLPTTFAVGPVGFTAHAGAVLAADTTYAVVATKGLGDELTLATAETDNEDSGAATGWSIGNHNFTLNASNTWVTSTNTEELKIAVKGYARPANNAPTVANPIPNQRATAGTAFRYRFPNTTFADADTDDALSYTATKADGGSLPTWLNFDADFRSFSGTPAAADVGPLSVKVTATDGADASVSDTFDISVVNPAPSVKVAGDWALVPEVLEPGDRFRLLFATSSGSSATSGDIDTYNAFVQRLASGGHSALQAYSSGFRLVGCTAGADALTNNATGYTQADQGVPIYWLNGTKVADNYADFYDGSWDDESGAKDESGSARRLNSGISDRPITGCNHDGTSAGADLALGAAEFVREGRPNSNLRNAGPLSSDYTARRTQSRPIYALSQVFEVGADNRAPALANDLQGQTGMEGMDFEFVVPENTFSDPDGDSLTYSASRANDSALPAWLGFDADARKFTSTRRLPDFAVGTHALKVSASDGTASASVNFNLTVMANCVAPVLGSRREVWQSTLTVGAGRAQDNKPYWGYVPPPTDIGALSDTDLDLGSTSYNVDTFLTNDASPGNWIFVYNPKDSGDPLINRGQVEHLRLHVCGRHYDLVDQSGSAGDLTDTFVSFSQLHGGPEGFDWSGHTGETRTVALSVPPNRPAAGEPTITGTFTVGQTLTADTSDITDADGLIDVTYDYVWIREKDGIETEINGATSSTYVLTDDDANATIKVEVEFEDNLHLEVQKPETRASKSYPESGSVVGTADMTLQALALSNAADDSAIGLTPAFAPGTTSYTARVVDTVTRITVTPTASNAGAAVAIQDNNNTDIADADTSKDGIQVNLAIGANVIKVKVTSAEDNMMQTYTVTVTRGGTNPSPTLTSIERRDPATSPTNADSLTWRVTFSENVTNVNAADFSVSNTTATLAAAAVTGTFDKYDVTASGGDLANLDATVTLGFAVGQNIADAEGNLFTVTPPSGADEDSYVVDNTAPTVTITRGPDSSDMPFGATFTFNEAVTGFTADKISVSNGKATGIIHSDANKRTYIVLIVPAADGTVTVSVAADQAQDAAGNGNAASAATSSAYTALPPPLVSNLGQVFLEGGTRSLAGTTRAAQRFTTGSHVHGYTLDRIDIVFDVSSRSRIALSLCAVGSDDFPDTTDCTDLTSRTSFLASVHSFAAPADTVLLSGTSYALVGSSADFARLPGTQATAEDSGSAAGWSISDNGDFDYGSFWTTNSSNFSRLIAVRGTAVEGNAAPTVANALEDQTGEELGTFNYTFDADTFSDPDGDPLTYSATLDGAPLPDWLTFTPGTRTFASTSLPAAAVGDNAIAVTATDNEDESVSGTFNLAVTANCKAPDLSGRREVWRATLTVGNSAGKVYGYWFDSGSVQYGALSDTSFTIGANRYIFGLLDHLAEGGAAAVGDLRISFGTSNLTTAELAALRVHVCDVTNDFSDATLEDDVYQWPGDIDWSGVTTRVVALSAPVNRPADGTPTVAGTFAVGETLTADTSAITDADGLTGVTYQYQWIREKDGSETEISGATSSTYDLVAADRLAKIKLRVQFKDNLHVENQQLESRASEALPQSGTVTDNTDASLRALDLSNAADDTAIALTPALAPGTTAYTAAVPNTVTQVTVAPAANNAAATFVIQDADDMNITDADTTKTGVQVAIDPGDNIIKVKVTAADTTTMQTYTVTLTQASDPPVVANPIPNRTGTEGTAFNFTFAANTFTDPDNDPLTYSATLPDDSALPSWLSFDADMRKFSSDRLPDAAVGTNTIKVTATDGVGQVSDEFDLTVAANCAAPGFGSRSTVWQGTLTVGEGQYQMVFDDASFWGYVASSSTGSLSDTDFELGSSTYTVGNFFTDFTDGNVWGFNLTTTDTAMNEVQAHALRVHVCGQHVDISGPYFGGVAPNPANSFSGYTSTSFTRADIDFDWSGLVNSTRTVAFSKPANRPADGTPTITGTFAVGQTLTADTSAITDPDGVIGVTYEYEWIREKDGSETPIPGANQETYDLATADRDALIKLRVKFKDNLHVENQQLETRTSSSYPDSGTVVDPADATLSALEISNAANDATAPLTPTFAKDTTDYVARFDTDVTRVTIAPTTNNPSATAVVQDTDDVAIDDDTTKPGAQADVAIGDNVIEIKVTAADGATTQTYTVTVIRGENDPPTLDNAIPNQSGREGSPFNFSFAANAFSDPDGDALTYSATLDGAELPDWLSFDTGTRTFASDRLPDAAVGTRVVAVTAADRFADTATDEFNLVVTENCATPVFDGRTTVWRGTLRVGASTVTPTYWGFDSSDSIGSLNITRFTLGLTNFTVDAFTTSRDTEGSWTFSVSGNNSMIAGQAGQLRVHVCDQHLDLNLTDDIASSNPEDLIEGFGEDQTDRFDWSRVRTRSVALSKPANRPATGLPEIGGAMFVGRTLTADTRGISDPDGLYLLGLGVNEWEYQWIRVRDGVETNIRGETGETYLLTDEDENAQIRLRVTFRDDLHLPGQQSETRTSEVRPRSGVVSVFTGGDAPPTGVTAIEVNGRRLTIAFAEDLHPASNPAMGDFTVRKAKQNALRGSGPSAGLPVSSLSVGASSVTLTLATPVAGADEDLRLDYAPAGTPIRFADGSELSAFSDATVANVTPYPVNDPDTLPPILRDEPPQVEDDTLTLLFDEQLDSNSVPAQADFEVRGAGGARIHVVEVSVGGAAVTLTLERPVEADESVTLKYWFRTSDGGSGTPVRDIAGNAHWGAGLLNVSNRTVVPPSDPQMTAQINGATLTLGFGRNLAAGLNPPPGDFTVKNTTRSRVFGVVTVLLPVDSVSASGRTVTLSLGSGPAAGEEVRLDYAPSGSPIRFVGGSELDAFANVPVTNVTAAASVSQTWPIGIRVEDAAAKEGPGATLEFTVRLDRAHREDITVEYATTDITAIAGEDYDATRGTLRIPAGQTRAAIQVPLREDYHNDNGETLLLTLSNPSTGRLAESTPTNNGSDRWRPQWDSHLDGNRTPTGNGTPTGGEGTAIGTIENADPMPGAWLSRFGRAASDNAVEAIARRWEADPAQPPETHFTLGGQRVGSMFERTGSVLDGSARGGGPDPSLEEPDPSGVVPSLRGAADLARLDLSPAHAPDVPQPTPEQLDAAGDARWAQLFLQGRTLLEDARRLKLRDVLMNSSFHYSPSVTGNDDADSPHTGWLGDWSAWGESSATYFGGAEGPLSLDGEVATVLVGLDSRHESLLGGVALSYTEGAGAYSAQQGDGGSVASTLTSFHPYAQYRFGDRISTWGVLGYGTGDLALTPQDADPIETDLSHAHAAFGARAALALRSDDVGQFELALRSDARFTHTASRAVTGLAGVDGATSRVRFMLEGAGSISLASSAVLTPSFEAGLRYDGGDAETGAGFELGAGLAYDSEPFEIRVDARTLAAHQDEAYEEWGFSGSVDYRPSSDGHGLSMKLGSSWGAAESGVQALWHHADATGLAGGAAHWQPGRRFQAELGYGLPGRRGRALWTPYLGADGGAGLGALRFGFTLASDPNVRTSLEFRVPQGTARVYGVAPDGASTDAGVAVSAGPSVALKWSLGW